MKNNEKKIRTVIALLMAVIMLFSVSVFAEEADPVLATVNGKSITRSQTEEFLMSMYVNGYIEDMSDYRAALDYLVNVTLLDEALKAEGYYDFTEEENEAFRARARQEAQDEMDYYVSYYLTEDTDEARAALQAEAEQYYAGYEEELLEELRYEAAYDRWVAELKPAEISDDMLKDLYEQYVAEDEELFADNVFMYEYYLYYGYYPFYTPEGYRRIRMIELQADAALLNAWAEAQNAFEEGAEGADADALKAAAEEAKEAVLASVQDQITEIQSALEKGEAFSEVVKRYDSGFSAADQGMTMIHENSILFDYYLIQAVFGPEMIEKGSVSGPILTQDGVVFAEYVDDVPAGAVELTDEIMELLRADMEDSAIDIAVEARLQEYRDQAEITCNDALIDELEAGAALADPEF